MKLSDIEWQTDCCGDHRFADVARADGTTVHVQFNGETYNLIEQKDGIRMVTAANEGLHLNQTAEQAQAILDM